MVFLRNVHISVLGSTFYISKKYVWRNEVDSVCKQVNGRNVDITTEAKFNTVSAAIMEWIHLSAEVTEVFYYRRAIFRFWTSSVYDHKVRSTFIIIKELINDIFKFYAAG